VADSILVHCNTDCSSRISHALGLDITCTTSLLSQFFLANLGLLILLNERATAAAARREQIRHAVSLEVVLLADIGALKHHGDEMETEAGKAGKHKAGGVDEVVAIHVAMFPASVVGFAKGDTRHAAGDQAGINGSEATKEGCVPWLCIWRGRSSNGGRVGQSIIEALDPVLHVFLIDSAALGRCRSVGGHCLYGSGTDKKE